MNRLSINEINSDQLDELYRRIETLEHVAAGNKRHVQMLVPELENAEAVIERVRAEANAWRRKAIRRALGNSQRRGAIEGCRDLIGEDNTRTDAWGDGYREAISDLREVLQAFGQLEDAHDGPSVAECAAADRRWPLEKAGE